MENRYYSLYQNEAKNELYIFGDITSVPWYEGDVSSWQITKDLAELDGSKPLAVYINSCGGEVGEGLAIYNALKRFGDVTTVCDGFAASIASVIFMAGSKRIISPASLLFIHNAWTRTSGNANELRKEADDLDKITSASVEAYKSRVNITEDRLKELLDAETWLTADEAVAMGFATGKSEDKQTAVPSQSVRGKVMQKLTAKPEPAKEPELSKFQKFFKDGFTVGKETK